jgi:kynureninase
MAVAAGRRRLRVSSTASPTDDLLRWRREFPILERTVHLINHSLGAMPRAVYDHLREYADVWASRGIRAWAEGWWEMPVTVGDLVGRIIGAGSGQVVIHQNVSVCQSVILSCFDFAGRRNKIVASDLDFPTVLYVHQAQLHRGARLELVKSEDGMTIPMERFLGAIDEETLLVPISHVLFRSGTIVDIPAIVERAQRVGALVILDAYQSAGTVPLDVGALGVDFAVGGSVKWLCGGPGAAYLYVRPDLVGDLRPTVTGWMAHAHPFDFELPPLRYADGMFRFLHGTPHVPALYAARAGYEIIQAVGVEKIRAKSIRQTSRLVELARAEGWRINSPLGAQERGGMVVVDVPHGAQVTKELIAREFLVDYRPGGGIRISPHFYTTDEEIEQVVREIREILETGASRRHERGSDF